jgi:hypothetical protein
MCFRLEDLDPDLDFADNICLMAKRFHDMEEKLTNLQEEAKRGKLNINVNKTNGMRIHNKIQMRLTVYRQDIEQVETSYLGSSVTKKGRADKDVKNRIKKADGTFIQLYPIWRNKYIPKKT